jgi:hypothetical protein
LAGVWSLVSGSRFCVGAFCRNLSSFAVKMFLNLVYFKKKCYKFCTFNAICKDNVGLNCFSVQHKKMFAPINVNGSYAKLV